MIAQSVIKAGFVYPMDTGAWTGTYALPVMVVAKSEKKMARFLITKAKSNQSDRRTKMSKVIYYGEVSALDTPTPSYKLYRSDDPSTSKEAAEKLDVSRMEKIVYDTIDAFGTKGCISDDVLGMLHEYGYSSVTARYKQLKEKGLVIVDGRKRQSFKSGRNQQIMWSKNMYREEDALPEMQQEN